MMKKTAAEAFGTFWLVFGGCGSAVLAAAFGGNVDIGRAIGHLFAVGTPGPHESESSFGALKDAH